MTPGLVLLLLGVGFYAFIAFAGKEAPKAFLYLAWGFMALWCVGTIVYGFGRLLLAG